MIPLMPSRWIDLLTQRWVRATGRRVDLLGEPWLAGPVGDEHEIGDAWLAGEADRLGAALGPAGPTGLLPTMSALDGPGFAAEDLHPAIRDFYEHTSSWTLEVSMTWSSLAWPFGWLIAAVFARRLQQLALPLRRVDTAAGMTSTVTGLFDGQRQVGALWLRRLVATGTVVYSGLYDTVQPPGAARANLRVTFPLPRGRLVVLLAADVTTAGGLRLSSTAGAWGAPGAYLVVENHRGVWARRVPLDELFSLYVDGNAVLRTDHHLRLRQLPVFHLHYRLTPRPLQAP